MFCAIRNVKKGCTVQPVYFFFKAKYSRKSFKDTNSYKVIKSDGEPLDDIENTAFRANPNWELLTPRGFRFYLPGSVGPGWLDTFTTAQVQTDSFLLQDEDLLQDIESQDGESIQWIKKQFRGHPFLHCAAQECPLLLRKGISELFSGCTAVKSPQLTIVTINQKSKQRSTRWSREAEMEKLAKYFVLTASEICMKLKMIGFWADFINPFSGQPYFNLQKSGSLYKTDQRFRCLGFKIDQKNYCKVISKESDAKNFVGNLYTTAPTSHSFLQDVISEINYY